MVLKTSSEMRPSPYVVGIDLGTTNSSVAFIDPRRDDWQVETFAINQLVAPGQVEARETLPSFLYQGFEGEFPKEALRLPWHAEEPKNLVGFLARDHGDSAPGRVISSAKSWLCHSGVDRTSELLPWHAATDVRRISPVEASASYLNHIRQSWNYAHPTEPLQEQDVVLTLPASFDEVARELTIKAARQAGLQSVVLVEEPQAAFYAWIYGRGDLWQQSVSPGQKILVCDIGGGTTDFTLIRVREAKDGKVQFHRVSVGPHLILGGDNLDLTLAKHLEQRLVPEGQLEPRQWSVLVRMCRRLKEELLGEDAPDERTLNLPGRGSKLLGGGLQLDVRRDEVEKLLIDGFLPRVDLNAKPISRSSGFQEFGLPYAPDAAITRYLAQFLTAHRFAGLSEQEQQQEKEHDPARPDAVLFNGGFFASAVLQSRLLETLSSWFPDSTQEYGEPQVLQNDRLDLAVAHGAAYYAMVRRGEGVKIAAGLARTYYVGAGQGGSEEPAAVCLVPARAEPGERIDLKKLLFQLRIREPVQFPLFVSSTRLTDNPGDILKVDLEQLRKLPPIRTVIESGKKNGPNETLSVQLHAQLTEIGTMEMWCGKVRGRAAGSSSSM